MFNWLLLRFHSFHRKKTREIETSSICVLTSKFYSVCSILVVFLLAKNLIKRDSIHDLKQDIGGDDPL